MFKWVQTGLRLHFDVLGLIRFQMLLSEVGKEEDKSDVFCSILEKMKSLCQLIKSVEYNCKIY